MSDYMCPTGIQETYELDPDLGRDLIVKWMETLELEVGDRVWAPEGGWMIKERNMEQ